MLTGQNGILNRTSQVKVKTENAQDEEQVKLSIMSSIGTDGIIDFNQLKDEIESKGGKVTGTIFPVVVTMGNATYQIDQNGKIKVANFEANWMTADSSNNNDDWYVYKDNIGNKTQVNVPKLADGMTAIKYETETAGSKWANAMTKDGSMWVWIPRYAYRITYNDSLNRKQGGTIEIAFLKGTTNEFLDSTIQGEVTTSINADGTTSQNKWLLEPAFTLGTEDISGFWFAKFEASPVGATSTSEAETNNKTKIMQIKPNQYSWRSISTTDIFEYCLNLKNMKSNNELVYFDYVNNVDTHMTKNIEWGAVAYLAHSKYGLNGEEIGINTNSSYKTGMGNDGSSAYNTDVGKNSSTTKNVYGVYDMSGGTWEYVAACDTEYTNKLTENINYISKYIDVYDSYSSSKFGDAIFETSSSSLDLNSWFSDYSLFVNSSSPVFKRGGGSNDGSGAGLFGFGISSGDAFNYYSFRPVCVVK